MRVSKESIQTETSVSAPDYYDAHAQEYVAATLDVDLSDLYDRFARYLPSGGKILDAGSGSGRDTLAFLARGYDVEAFDSSRELCALSARLTGVRTRCLRFQDLSDLDRYDGIWACASLLHVPEAQLRDAIHRLVLALKSDGALYMSFKYGAGERVSSDGRLYTDMTAEALRAILRQIPDAVVCETWISEGEGRLKGQGRWLNAIVRKRPERTQL